MKTTYSEIMIIRNVLFISLLIYCLTPLNSFGGASVASYSERNDTTGFTEIFFAAKQGDVVKVRNYIKSGGDINVRKGLGVTPLIIASSYGQTAVAKLLLESGAETDISTSNGNTAIIHAGINKSWDIVELLVKHGADVNVIPDRDSLDGPVSIYAAWTAPSKIFQLLLDNGADINYGTQLTDRTPLAHALMAGRDDNVKLLLKYGADPRSAIQRSNYDGRSALWHARENDHYSTVKLIKDALQYKPFIQETPESVDALVSLLYQNRRIRLKKESQVLIAYLEDRHPSSIKLIRNAIFARHNYPFSTKYLKGFFSSRFQNYRPKKDKEVNLSSVDKENVQYLVKLEKKLISKSSNKSSEQYDFRISEGIDLREGSYINSQKVNAKDKTYTSDFARYPGYNGAIDMASVFINGGFYDFSLLSMPDIDFRIIVNRNGVLQSTPCRVCENIVAIEVIDQNTFVATIENGTTVKLIYVEGMKDVTPPM